MVTDKVSTWCHTFTLDHFYGNSQNLYSWLFLFSNLYAICKNFPVMENHFVSQITNFKACSLFEFWEFTHKRAVNRQRQADRQSTMPSTHVGEGNYFHNTYECSIVHVDCRAKYIDLTMELGEHYWCSTYTTWVALLYALYSYTSRFCSSLSNLVPIPGKVTVTVWRTYRQHMSR